MTDQAIARRLAYIHQTLELIAFLLAVFVAGTGGLGLLVGAGAAVILIVNALARSLGAGIEESIGG